MLPAVNFEERCERSHFVQIFKKIDIGKVRNSNQDAADAFMLSPNTAFAIVCDGIGGSSGGEIASGCAVETVSEYVKNAFSVNMDNEKLTQLLKNAISSANVDLFRMSSGNNNLSGMGTTVVASIVTDNYAIICHVGDSRAYLIGDDIIQITTDHSVVQSLIESGQLSLSEAKYFPDKNIITRALGVQESVIADCSVVPINEGDSILLCSDGLTNYTEPSHILSIFKNNEIFDVPDLLIQIANSGGGGDNISVAVVTKERG